MGNKFSSVREIREVADRKMGNKFSSVREIREAAQELKAKGLEADEIAMILKVETRYIRGFLEEKKI